MVMIQCKITKIKVLRPWGVDCNGKLYCQRALSFGTVSPQKLDHYSMNIWGGVSVVLYNLWHLVPHCVSTMSLPPRLARFSVILNQLPFSFMVLLPEWNNTKHLDFSKLKNVKAAPYKLVLVKGN